MKTEEFLQKLTDVDFRRNDSDDDDWEDRVLSPEGEIIRFAKEIMKDRDAVLNKIEGQRFVG